MFLAPVSCRFDTGRTEHVHNLRPVEILALRRGVEKEMKQTRILTSEHTPVLYGFAPLDSSIILLLPSDIQYSIPTPKGDTVPLGIHHPRILAAPTVPG